MIGDRLRFFVNRLRERLWVKPAAMCLLSIAAAFVAKAADGTQLAEVVPSITAESVEALLSIMAASMLLIATFAVGSMVSAYASASSSATPRSFRLVLADDVSQNALSTFLGAFIFSIVALTAVKNDYFGTAGLFSLFSLTAVVFALVILTFVRWVDRIARLGRLGMTIHQVERVAEESLRRRRAKPRLCGVPALEGSPEGEAVFARAVGYVQRIDVATLQACAEEGRWRVSIAALPGSFAVPGRPLAHVRPDDAAGAKIDSEWVSEAFVIGEDRLFDEDPRFGLVVLAEIAGRALSPAVNDPGTAIAIIGTLTRLLANWSEPAEETSEIEFDRVEVPELSVRDMFDDAFTAIARDGAHAVEVSVRLQKALQALASLGDADIRDAAMAHARMALARAEKALDHPEDLAAVRETAKFAVRA